MRNIAHKATGDYLTAEEFNDIPSEEENLITSAGITLSSGDLYQIAKAVAKYSSAVNFCVDTGVANAYVLTTPAPMQAPPVYFNGMRITFRTSNANTGPSTINFNGYGVKAIVREDGVTPLSAGDLPANEMIEVGYNLSAGNFEMISHKYETGLFVTADVKFTGRVAADNGWIMYSADGTIGSAASSATIRANADCESLFTYYWTHYSDAQCPLDGGVRGGSAAADWSANRRLHPPKYYNNVLAAVSASHALGSAVGSETHVLSLLELTPHDHDIAVLGGINVIQAGPNFAPSPGKTGATGSGVAFSIMQPTYFINLEIKL